MGNSGSKQPTHGMMQMCVPSPGKQVGRLPLITTSNQACDAVTSLKVLTNNAAGKATEQLQRWHWAHSSSTWVASSNCRGIHTATHRRGAREIKTIVLTETAPDCGGYSISSDRGQSSPLPYLCEANRRCLCTLPQLIKVIVSWETGGICKSREHVTTSFPLLL